MNPRLRVVTINPDSGVGYELTDRVAGLSWSTVRPGGCETANFSLLTPWISPNPEVDKRNLVLVYSGLDVVYQGRIEDVSREESDGVEALAVTAYGLGTFLRSTVGAEIFMDQRLDQWHDPPITRQKALTGNSFAEVNTSHGRNSENGGAGIMFDFYRFSAGAIETGEQWYYGGGLAIAQVRFDFISSAGTDANFADTCFLPADEAVSSYDITADLNGTTTLNGWVDATTARYHAGVQSWYFAGTIVDSAIKHSWENIRVLGDHGLDTIGTWPDEGLLVSQMIAYLVDQVPGVIQRRVDATSAIIAQAVYMEPQPIEEIIADLHRFHVDERCWGTWGPNSVFDDPTIGYFDYASVDTLADWLCPRELADSLSLDSHLSDLFNVAEVSYTDVGDGSTHSVTRTRPVPELGDEQRVRQLNAGTTVLEAAETYGDAILAAFGGFAPAAGSLGVSAYIPRAVGGALPPEYLRADGSALRVPDILETPQLFELGTDPDRRTTFPIKRVSVDASGDLISASIELDQGSDALDQLDARRGQALERALIGF